LIIKKIITYRSKLQNNKLIKIDLTADGIGIDTTKTQTHTGGNGLKNITKRIEAVRGRAEITNNHGTEIIFYIPL
jgi:signal transduction histidine kinase